MENLQSEELKQRILNDLTTLILRYSTTCAREQYQPSRDADTSDDYIKEHKEWVTRLRHIRENLENLMTGLL